MDRGPSERVALGLQWSHFDLTISWVRYRGTQSRSRLLDRGPPWVGEGTLSGRASRRARQFSVPLAVPLVVPVRGQSPALSVSNSGLSPQAIYARMRPAS